MVGYTEETLQKALKMVREGTLNRKSASRIFNIPRQTIQYRLGSKFKKPGKGPSTTLSKTEEEVLVKWLKENARKGFPKREADLLDSVSDFIKQDGRITPFKEDSSSYTVLDESSERTIETIEMPRPSGEELSRAIEDSSSYTVLDESSEQTIETIEMPRPGEKVSLNEVVRWPDSPKRKGNRACARMPYVISSKQWKELYDERKKKKEAEEEEKNKRRIIREQNKQRRDEEANAKRMAKSKKMKTTIMTTKRLPPRDGEKENPKFLPPREANLENSKEEDTPINNSTRSLCFVCGGCTKQSDRIECEICDKLFHLKCVAVKENEVFVCDPCLKENELEL